MNERIKELAVQADNYAYKMNPEEDSYGRPANPRKFQQDRDTKFAELLVKECVDICTNVSTSVECEYNKDKLKQTLFILDQIKKHFGVEE